jgi:hypothetical protein
LGRNFATFATLPRQLISCFGPWLASPTWLAYSVEEKVKAKLSMFFVAGIHIEERQE